MAATSIGMIVRPKSSALNGEAINKIATCFEMWIRFPIGRKWKPAYHPSDLLQLFIYGHLNRMRSSKSVEKECARNIEQQYSKKYRFAFSD